MAIVEDDPVRMDTAVELNERQSLTIKQTSDGTLLTVNSSGSALVSLKITENSAEVLLSDGCAIQSRGDLSLEADTLSLKAREKLSLTSSGDAEVLIDGDMTSKARIQTLRSTLGNVNIKANDDVKVRAERICLNT